MEYLEKKYVNKKIFFIIFFIIFNFAGLLAQQTATQRIERAYQGYTLSHNDPMLDIIETDSNAVKAVKNYYRAILNPDLHQSMLLHSFNFSSYNREVYAQLSGIQLVTIDFINKEYEKALEKLESIEGDRIPEAIYWNAKIYQVTQQYDEAIAASQHFIRRHSEHPMLARIWLVIMESFYGQKDLRQFERHLNTFSTHRNFNEYKPYLYYLNGLLQESVDMSKARTLYSQIINDFPQTQYRIQAEDRLYQMRFTTDRPSTDFTQTEIRQNEPVTSVSGEQKAEVYYIQFGVFSAESSALNYVSALARDNVSAFHIIKQVSGSRFFAVVQGPFYSGTDAQNAQNSLNQKNYQTFVFKAEQ